MKKDSQGDVSLLGRTHRRPGSVSSAYFD